MDWIDVPVLKAMEYFSGVMAWFMKFGTMFASIIGLLGIFWAGFKVLNARIGAKQAFWDILYKWLLFTIMINLYIPAANFVGKIGNQIGTEAGNGKQTIVDALKSIKQTLEADLERQAEAAESLNANIIASLGADIKKLNVDMDFSHYDSYNEYVHALENAVSTSNLKRAQKNTMNEVVLHFAKFDTAYLSAHNGATLKAIKSVLVEKKMDGTDGENLVDSYVDLDIFLKDKDGNDSPYFSPSALCRLVMLTTQIMRAKLDETWALADRDWNINQDALNDDLNWLLDGSEKIANRFEKIMYPITIMFDRILPNLLCFAAQVLLVFTSIFCCINYIMIVLEYVIVMGIGSFFLPFILFDGTKDMAKKLVPVFTGFLIKFIVIDIIMFFVYWLYIDQCVNTIGDSGGMNFTMFATVAFNAVVAFVLTRHAPKISDTLLTGRPSLDFGEFRQSMHDARAAAHDIKVAGKGAAKVGAGVVRGGANFGINTLGRIHKAHEAGHEAADIYKAANPGQSGDQLKDGMKSAYKGARNAVYKGEALEFLKAKGEQFLHGGKGGSGSGSGGGTSNSAYMRSGQQSQEFGTGNRGDSLNNNSNAKFQNASMYDGKTGGSRNMTLGEFMGERGSQGKTAGKQWAADHGFERPPEPKQNPYNKEADIQEKQAENLDPGAATEQSGSIGGKRQASGVPDGQQGSDNKEADIAEKQAEKHASDAENTASEAKDAANDAKNGNAGPQGGNGRSE